MVSDASKKKASSDQAANGLAAINLSERTCTAVLTSHPSPLPRHPHGGGEALDRVYERLEAIDASTAEKRAADILFGLGFNKQIQAKKTRDFSAGGWRMRIALATG
ncbi:hypothetical protein ABZP36_035715 [Zizania latifolia]